MSASGSLLKLVFPPSCVLCSRPGTGLCTPCIGTLSPAPDLDAPDGLASCSSLLDYDGAGRDVVAALKFSNHRDALDLLGAAMAQLLDSTATVPDVITWAPTSSRRARRRGFDQAELLARAVAASTGTPCRSLLRRSTQRSQTGHGRAERLSGPSFVARRSVAGPSIVLVDDVRTTGSTLQAAASALRSGCGATVHGLTLAAVP